MGRLIDADVVWRKLQYRLKKYGNEHMSEKFKEMLDSVPTAYDVEKVVAELACNSRFIDDINEHNIKCISCVIGQKTAIEIVRKGGVEHG